MRPYTDQEWEDLPHVIMTSDVDWDPSQLDHNLDDELLVGLHSVDIGERRFSSDEYLSASVSTVYRGCIGITRRSARQPLR